MSHRMPDYFSSQWMPGQALRQKIYLHVRIRMVTELAPDIHR